MSRYILDFIPAEIAQFLPPATRPSTHWGDHLQLMLSLDQRVWRPRIDRRHNSIHQTSHRPKTCAVHEATLVRRLTPRIGKCLLYCRPIDDENLPDSGEVCVACCHVAIGKKATGRRTETLLNELYHGSVGNDGRSPVFDRR